MKKVKKLEFQKNLMKRQTNLEGGWTMNRLEEKYKKEVVPSLMGKYNYRTVMLVPKIEKIVVKKMGLEDV